jgi:hypothetical protein
MPLNYDSDIKIEETALDVEWLEQPALALKYGQHSALMRKRAKEAAERVKVLVAELTRKARQSPKETTHSDRPTVGDIEAYYLTKPEYQEAKQAQFDAEYEADYADHARSEMSFSRKQSLENLVVLHGQQYFAGPSMPRDLAKEWQKRAQRDKAVSASIGSAIKRTRTVNNGE